MRNGNLDEFFEHRAYPPALSQNRKLRSSSKSDLVGYLEDLVISQEKTNNPELQVIILDGPTVVNKLRQGYGKKSLIMHHKLVFLPYCIPNTACKTLFGTSTYMYLPESLKAETRSKRGKEVRRQVEPSTTIPGNWKEF